MPEEAELELAARIARVRETIAEAALRSGRRPEDVTLIAVSKTFGPDRVLAAVQHGITDLGENRVQEAEAKIAALADRVGDRVNWHLIGHLQSNKAKTAVRLFTTIESVDSLHLAELLSRLAAQNGRILPVLLEVNVGDEPSKFGFAPALLPETLPRLLALPMLDIRGLMTVAPAVADADAARPYFRQLRELRDRLATEHPTANLRELSMGMSGDFAVAIEEGATIVRLGRVIFGERL